MSRHAFRNALCILRSIDGWDLRSVLSPAQERAFTADPVRFFVGADDTTAEAIWRLIEARMPPLPPGVQLVFSITEAA